MTQGAPLAIDIQEHLSAFDSWLTGRIKEAHAGGKDLAFRDRAPEEQAGYEPPWEYSLLEPGARSPAGDTWSVYRFSGLRPEPLADSEDEAASAGRPRRRSLLDVIADAVLGKGPTRR